MCHSAECGTGAPLGWHRERITQGSLHTPVWSSGFVILQNPSGLNSAEKAPEQVEMLHRLHEMHPVSVPPEPSRTKPCNGIRLSFQANPTSISQTGFAQHPRCRHKPQLICTQTSQVGFIEDHAQQETKFKERCWL